MFVSACPLCRHTKTDGHRCKSPAVTGNAYCCHHRKLHRIRRNAISAGPGLSTNVLQPLHNARSIHQALAMVLNGLASNRLTPKVAGKMFYGLQIASGRPPKGAIE
jgi:hypothetical protein